MLVHPCFDSALWFVVRPSWRTACCRDLPKNASMRILEEGKEFYSSAPAPIRLLIRSLYKTAYLSAIAASGRNPFGYVFNYHNRTRGMSFHHDIHDWLGGYPYESASPDELAGFMAQHGLSIERSFQRPAAVKGFFGSHCDELVARRKPS
jgi:hypothetical protein